MTWDIYECANGHKIVIENLEETAMKRIVCPVCDKRFAQYKDCALKLDLLDKTVRGKVDSEASS